MTMNLTSWAKTSTLSNIEVSLAIAIASGVLVRAFTYNVLKTKSLLWSSLLCALADLLPQIAVLCVARLVYILYLHPLRHFPGPKLAAFTRLAYIRALLQGDLVRWLHELHTTYGEVVRIAPDELSFISGESAWHDIYGAHTGEKAATGKYLKDRRWFAEPYNDTWSILQADAEAHPRMRRILAPAFSDRALREQESLIQGYVDLFVQRLHEQASGTENGEVDLVRWFNYFTFEYVFLARRHPIVWCAQPVLIFRAV